MLSFRVDSPLRAAPGQLRASVVIKSAGARDAGERPAPEQVLARAHSIFYDALSSLTAFVEAQVWEEQGELLVLTRSRLSGEPRLRASVVDQPREAQGHFDAALGVAWTLGALLLDLPGRDTVAVEVALAFVP